MPFSTMYPLAIAAAYILGSIPFSYLFARLFHGIDITKQGSRNSGATNLSRVLKQKWYFPLLVALDAGRAYAILYIIQDSLQLPTSSWAMVGIALAIVLGNSYSPFLYFSGGKGVATSLGIILFFFPLYTAAMYLFAWMLLLAMLREVGLASPLATLFGAGWLYAYGLTGPLLALVCALAIVIIWRHYANLWGNLR